MLDRRGNNVVPFVTVGVGHTLQDSIVRLTPPTREYDFRSGASQEYCDPGSGAFHRFFGDLAIDMRTGRVAVVVQNVWLHRFGHGRVYWCSSVAIKIDRLHPILLC